MAEPDEVIIELDPATVDWTRDRPDAIPVVGDAADQTVADQAADQAQNNGMLAGWVNNAAVFRDTENRPQANCST